MSVNMIYFLKDTGTQAIKIGYSAKPKGRVGGLQTGNPHKLIMLGFVAGTKEDEAVFHLRFAQYQMEGEWFRGDIIEEVLEIISTYKEQRLAMRRVRMTEANDPDVSTGESFPSSVGGGVLDKETGIEAVCKIPGLRMTKFSIKLTEQIDEHANGDIACGGEIVYLLEFENEVTEASELPLSQLRRFFVYSGQTIGPTSLRHVFIDEDNVVIPLAPGPWDHHVVGGQEAITGGQGEAFRVLVVWEKLLRPNYAGVRVKGIFMGENYIGEHPLKTAKKLVVSIR
jgi:hypothetical protein